MPKAMVRIVLFALLAGASSAAVAAVAAAAAAVTAASGAGKDSCTQAALSRESESYDSSYRFQLLQVTSSQENARPERSSSRASVSLTETRPEARQVTPLAPSRTVHFASVETRGDPLLAKVGPPSQQVHNPGKGQKYEGFRSKSKLLLPFLKTLPDQDLVAYADGGDVIWGGCDLADFLHAYERIVNRSGAPVVFGAEVSCWENPCDEVPETPTWAYELANGRDLGGGFLDSFAPGCFNKTYEQNCSRPVAFKFLNAGFFMGPAHELVKMVEWVLSNYDENMTPHPWGGGDQSVYARYWIDHPRDVTLDYTNELCITFTRFLSGDMLSVDVERRVVINNAFGRVQCMIHGAGGDGKARLDEIVEELSRTA